MMAYSANNFLPFFLQNRPVLCKVSGNLSELVFLLELDSVIIDIIIYYHVIEYHHSMIDNSGVVV